MSPNESPGHLAQQLHLLSEVTNLCSDAMFIKNGEGRYLYCNPAGARLAERTVEEMLGRTDAELFDDAAAILIRAQDARVMATGQSESEEHVIQHLESTLAFNVTKMPFRDETGEIVGVVGIAREITKEKAAIEALFEQQTILEEIAQGVPLKKILTDLVAIIEQHAPGLIGSILLLDADQRHLHVAASRLLPESYNAAIDGVAIGPQVGSCGTAAFRQEKVFVSDIATDPLWSDYRDLALAHGLQACWSIPIRSKGDPAAPVLGTFAVYSRTPGLPDEQLGCLIERLEQLAGVAIESRRNLQSLQESEARFRQMLESLPVGVFVHDGQQIYYANPTALDMLGVEDSEAVFTRSPFDFVTPDYQELAHQRVETLLSTGQRLPTIEAQVRRMDGTEIDVEVTSIPVMYYGKKCVQVLFRDITGRKQSEQKLINSERRFRELADAIPQIVWVAGPDGGLTHLNAKAVFYTGVEMNQLTGWSWEHVIHPDDLPHTLTQWSAILRNRQPHDVEFRIRRADGEYRWHITRMVPVSDGKGENLTWYGTCTDIEDLKQSEQALKQSERSLSMFRDLVNLSNDAVFVINPETSQFLDVNQNACDRLGFPREELLRLGVISVETLLLDITDWHEHVREVQSRGQMLLDGMHRRGDGTTYPVEINVTYVTVEQQAYMIAVSRDISERQQATQALRLSEDRFSKLFYASPFSIIVASYPEGIILEANHAFLRLFEFDRDEVLGKTTAELNIWVDPQNRVDMIDQLQLYESARDMEIEFRKKSGELCTLLMSVEIIRIQGQPFSLAMSIDITSRKSAEQQMRYSLSLLKATLDSTADGILVVDLQGWIVDFNQQFLDMWNFPQEMIPQGRREDIITAFNTHHSVLRMLSQLKDDVPGFVRRVREIYQSPEKPSFDVLEFHDGRVLERFSQPQRVGGVPVGCVWSFRDVSTRKRLEEQLRQSQKMEAIGQLAGGVAHDFNNLLTVINGYGDILLGKIPESSPWRESVSEIRSAGERATQLTRQLLTFSRRAIVEPRQLDMNEVIEESRRMLERLVTEMVQFEVLLDPGIGCIFADRNQIDQLLLNLVVNAADAMPYGGRLTIQTRPVVIRAKPGKHNPQLPPGNFVQLSVTDTGMGMSEEVKQRIFEPFFTTKGVGKGTGLGMAVVHGIIQQSNGFVEIESQEGVGTTFRIWFPITQEADLLADDDETLELRLGTETLLLVEDESAVRRMTRALLEEQGYHVLEASCGQDAIRQSKTFLGPIHALITDVVMPDLSGLEVAQAILSERPQIRVLYISGYSDDTIKRFGLEAASLELLQKPFSPLQLARRIREILESASEH